MKSGLVQICESGVDILSSILSIDTNSGIKYYKFGSFRVLKSYNLVLKNFRVLKPTQIEGF